MVRGGAGDHVHVVMLRCRVDRRRGRSDQLFGTRDVRFAAGAGEQSIVADAMEPLGQNMEQKAPDELVGRE